MESVHLSKEEMERDRVARFADMPPRRQGFLDTRIDAHARDTFNVIGPGVTEDAALTPGIADARDFNVTYIGAEPGKGAALHDHPTVEVFIPLSGPWTFYWNQGDAQEEITLETMDCISVPPGVMRGFRNAGDSYAHLLVVLGGADSGKVSWATSVFEQAATTGLKLDGDGNIVEVAAAE
jgi:quercetin dioxygenase-like cupin family protein